jgi:hypothetical protein
LEITATPPSRHSPSQPRPQKVGRGIPAIRTVSQAHVALSHRGFLSRGCQQWNHESRKNPKTQQDPCHARMGLPQTWMDPLTLQIHNKGLNALRFRILFRLAPLVVSSNVTAWKTVANDLLPELPTTRNQHLSSPCKRRLPLVIQGYHLAHVQFLRQDASRPIRHLPVALLQQTIQLAPVLHNLLSFLPLFLSRHHQHITRPWHRTTVHTLSNQYMLPSPALRIQFKQCTLLLFHSRRKFV